MSGDEDLSRFANRLRGLQSLTHSAAKDAAERVEVVVKQTAAAGTDLDGKPWPPKKDGTRALPNAASAVSAVARGAVIVVTLVGAYVYHQFSKGPQRRAILPDGGAGTPKRVAEAIRAATQDAFKRAMSR